MTHKSFVIVVPTGRGYTHAQAAADKIAALLTWKGHRVVINGETKRCDLALSIGGDGTMMHAVSRFSPRGVPTIGINAGDVGFLTSGDISEWEHIVDQIESEKYLVEERIALRFTHNQCSFGPFANDIVLKHPFSIAGFRIAINGQVFFENSAADGVIVATPTGSTAYNTSVGGPIILPSSRNVVLSMISPTRVSTCPLVFEELADGGKLTITVNDTKKNQPVLVSADATQFETQDGFTQGGLTNGESITVTMYPKPILFATFGLGSYVAALNEKKGFAR